MCDSTEFDWTNPRTGVTQQLFAVLAVWGYPAGSSVGRLWALRAVPSDTKVAWKELLRSLPGTPALVVSDGDKAIGPAVRETWPDVALHLCEHHLYKNAAAALAADGERGLGNPLRTLLNDAAKSPEGWQAFRTAVDRAGLAKTGAWVAHWDDRRWRTAATKLADPTTTLLDGSRTYTLRKHPVPPRAGP